MTQLRPWRRLRPRDLFQHPDRVAVVRNETGFTASDGVMLWNLGYWGSNPVTASLRDGRVHHLRANRADDVEEVKEHADDLVERRRATVGGGPEGHFQASRTPWNGREFALWAVHFAEHGVFPLGIGDRITDTLRGEYFRVYARRPADRYALITCGMDVVGVVRPIRFGPGDPLGGDAVRLAERFREYMPHQWPAVGPV
jgi:hypothetical protein